MPKSNFKLYELGYKAALADIRAIIRQAEPHGQYERFDSGHLYRKLKELEAEHA